jgi:hypothetical protein
MALIQSQQIINRILSDIEAVRDPSETAREWRDLELKSTDWIVSILDHPERESYLTYRTKLRDWPTTDDFPNTKPTL